MTAVAAARLSVAVAVVILGLKGAAWALTGSVAFFSDALESLVNILAAMTALTAIQLADRPADADHPFGHSKFEYLSAVIEGVLIVVASVAIVITAVGRLLDPQPITGLGIGSLLALVASALNGGLARYLIRLGRSLRSPALIADGLHLWADVITSVGVVAGVALAGVSGWWLLDPLLALAVAVNVVRVGWRLLRDSVGGLVDEGLPDDEVARVEAAIRSGMAGALEVHDLRTRRAGRTTFVTFHLIVPGDMSVREAHAMCDRIEAAVEAEVAGSFVTIHVEPESKAKHQGFVVRTGQPPLS